MKKIFMLMSSVFLASPIYADAITDGISTAGDAVFSYTSYVQAFGYVLSCIIGIVGAFVIYNTDDTGQDIAECLNIRCITKNGIPSR